MDRTNKIRSYGRLSFGGETLSFRNRLLLSFSLLIAFTFGIGGTLLISSSFYSLLDKEKAAAISEYETIQNNLMMLFVFGEYDSYTNLAEMLRQMEEQNIAHWQAISLYARGGCIYENGNMELLTKELTIQDRTKYAYVHTIDEKGPRLQMYSEWKTGNDILFLKASFDLSSAYAYRQQQQKLFLSIYLVVIFLGIGIAGIMSYLLTNRLQKLTTVVREISDGNLEKRTKLRTGDEFEQLSRDFDSMTDKLQENILTLESDVERKEAFMGAVAHELKTPMTSIIGYADLIRQCSLKEKEMMMAANYIYTEGQRLEQLSHKILDLLLMEKDKFVMKEVELDNFLKAVIDTLRPIAEEKQITLQLESEDGTILIESDLGKSLLYNLIDNAMKATSAGGNVCVKGRLIPSGCEIMISDTGCGMEESEISKITEAFYRVDKSRSRMQGGVGLGLTLCKKIVELHHGTMEFQSTKGKGSCVVVELMSK